MYHAAHQQLARCTGDCGWPRRIPRGSAVDAQPATSIDKPTGIGAGPRARLAAAAAGRGERPAGRWVNRRWSYRLETAPLYRKRHFSLKRRSLSVVVGELLEARRVARGTEREGSEKVGNKILRLPRQFLLLDHRSDIDSALPSCIALPAR